MSDKEPKETLRVGGNIILVLLFTANLYAAIKDPHGPYWLVYFILLVILFYIINLPTYCPENPRLLRLARQNRLRRSNYLVASRDRPPSYASLDARLGEAIVCKGSMVKNVPQIVHNYKSKRKNGVRGMPETIVACGIKPSADVGLEAPSIVEDGVGLVPDAGYGAIMRQNTAHGADMVLNPAEVMNIAGHGSNIQSSLNNGTEILPPFCNYGGAVEVSHELFAVTRGPNQRSSNDIGLTLEDSSEGLPSYQKAVAFAGIKKSTGAFYV